MKSDLMEEIIFKGAVFFKLKKSRKTFLVNGGVINHPAILYLRGLNASSRRGNFDV